jgi:hypothetical protein
MTMVVGSFDDEQMPRAKSIISCRDSGVISCPVLEILMPTRCSTIRGWRLGCIIQWPLACFDYLLSHTQV